MITEPQITVTTEIVVQDKRQTTVNLVTTEYTAIIKFVNGVYDELNLRYRNYSTSYIAKPTPEFLRRLADIIEKGA